MYSPVNDMEIDGPSWIHDVEKAGEKNAVNIARLYERVDQVQDDVLASREESKARSDERLEAIMARFDRLDRAEEKKDARTLAAKRLWIPLIVSAVLGLGGMIKLAYLDPLSERLDAIDRRIKYVEQDRDDVVISGDSK